MSRTSSSKIAAVVLMGFAVNAVSLAASAESMSKTPCKKASNTASWFEAQRQLTDGHADPYVAAR